MCFTICCYISIIFYRLQQKSIPELDSRLFFIWRNEHATTTNPRASKYDMFFSIGDIYVQFLLCKPKIFIFKYKKIYYKDAFVSNIGKKLYIKDISSVLISNSAKSKNLLDILCSENIFFMISSMCTNDKNEIIDIHAYIMSNINKYKQEDGNISNSL